MFSRLGNRVTGSAYTQPGNQGQTSPTTVVSGGAAQPTLTRSTSKLADALKTRTAAHAHAMQPQVLEEEYTAVRAGWDRTEIKPAAEAAAPTVTEPAAETAVEEPKEVEAVSPTKEKSNFLVVVDR